MQNQLIRLTREASGKVCATAGNSRNDPPAASRWEKTMARKHLSSKRGGGLAGWGFMSAVEGRGGSQGRL